MRTRKPTSAPPPEPEAPTVDLPFLLAKLRNREGDRDAVMAAAQARVFQTEIGRLVLLNHLMESGVGAIFGPGRTAEELQYAIGRHDAAVQLANAAGYDQAALAAAVLTDNLIEENRNEDLDAHGFRPGPEQEF